MERSRVLAVAVVLWGAVAWAAADPSPGAVNAQTLKLPDGPGSVRGMADDPSVEVFSGQVSYQVPLDVPAGVAGFAPKLSLSYSGEVGNGPLGVGWALPQMALKRSVRLGVPTYGASDELELVGVGGGGRLVALADSTWRLEGRGQAFKVERDGDGYVVTESGGVRYRLGVTAAGRQAEGTRVAGWYLEEAVHPTGQTVTYGYLQHNGQQYLSSVVWGPNSSFRVEFAYGARPDITVSYRTGFRVETAQRLTEVRVFSFGTLLRVYVPGYDVSLPLSRLASLSMLGKLRQGSLPTLTFSYAPRSNPNLVQTEAAAGWALNVNGTSLVDIDGDGVTDLLRLTASGHSWRKGTGTGFAPQRPISGAAGAVLSSSRLIDVDGDSRPELVRFFSEAWQINFLQGEAFGPTTKWLGTDSLPLFNDSTFFADLNGDGRVDVVRTGSESLSVRWNRASGLSASVTRPGIDGAILMPGPNVRFHEVNGDGLADAVQLGSGWYKLFLGKGDGTFVSAGTFNYPWGDSTNTANVRLGDLNHDGLMDLVYLLNGYAHWYPGRGGGAVETTARILACPGPNDTSTVVALGDVTGNGSEDIVWSSTNGMWALDMAGATSAGMLTGIDNGMGKALSISYQGSGQLSVAAEAAGTPWVRKLPTSIPVPVRLEVQPGAGEPARVVEYTVRDGFWDGVERRFGGFLTGGTRAVGSSPSDTLSIETRYEEGSGASRVLRGLPLEATKKDGLGTLYTRALSSYEARPVDGLPDVPLLRKPALLDSRTFHYEGVSSPIETLTTYSYDVRVRPIEEVHHGRLDITGDEKTVRRAFASDDVAWVQDVLCEERLLEADGTLVSHSRVFYGDASQVYSWTDGTQCRAGRLVRETHSWLADSTNPHWVLQSSTEYDAWDNPTRQYSSGTWRTLTYDANHLHPVSETVSPEAGRNLTWTLQWDDVAGLAGTLTDPDGITTEVTYDSLGRPMTLAVGGASPHVRYFYDWAAPRPKTLVYSFDGAPEALEGSWTGDWVEGGPWRQQVTVSNGAGEALYSATRLSPSLWTVSDWRERDAHGRVVYVAQPFYWDGALPTARPTNAVGQLLAYDAQGRIVQQTLPNNAIRTFGYKAFETTLTDSELAPVVSRYDGLGRITRTQRQVDTTLESVGASYDAAGRIRTLSLQDGTVTHSFSYDSLGRLVSADDPDIGARTLRYDDRNRLTHHTNGANQTRQYFYDDVGRLTRTLGEDGTAFVYHYDLAQDGTSSGYTSGRLAWVEEPRGQVHLTYDVFGREARHRRSVDGIWAEEATSYSPSGLPLASEVDGVRIPTTYDPAGRAIRIGTYWEALQLDAAGRVLEERYGNGVRQVYERNVLGLPRHIQTLRPTTGVALYDVTVTRNSYGAPTTVTDDDGVGLNHASTFDYDEAARLTDAILGAVKLPDGTLGEGTASFHFSYQYDGLQNMVQRQASGPKALSLLQGSYHYGERGFGPRQLTRVASASGDTLLDYDAAGRLISQSGRTMEYNGLDQLVRVTLPGTETPAATVEHAYGYDGLRILTRDPDGDTQYWFSSQLTERQGQRERYVMLDSRVIARVTQTPVPESGALARATGLGSVTGATVDEAVAFGLPGLVLGAMGLVLLAVLALRAPMRGRGQRLLAGTLAVSLLALSCDAGVQGARLSLQQRALWEAAGTLYFHAGLSAGPALLTRADASVYEERRYEPFGVPIDAYREFEGGGSQVGEVDHAGEPLNTLNKLTDAHTGWSDHGARWMAPETARWLTPDPPVKTPDPKFLTSPWSLHPYQHVRQNPVLYWDPDGQMEVPIVTPGTPTYVPPPSGNMPYADPTPVRVPMQFPTVRGPPMVAPPVPELPPIEAPPPGFWVTAGRGLLAAVRFVGSAAVVGVTVLLLPGTAHAPGPHTGIKPSPADVMQAAPGDAAKNLGRVVYPRGPGAATSPVPPGYVPVSRWVTETEAKLWIDNGGTYIPGGVGGESGRIYVTVPGEPRPGGTGPVRIDFTVDSAALNKAGKEGWFQIFQPVQNMPVHNVTITYPPEK
ncbi:FG-GAP-like repeat-containing protein [Hyalangium versicolor]|uniref:FG-GAP-like repeat-containing protein n=1 Tax=Hyalangium versicolor TaxID=2861190 RepID=UPI001CC99DD8|nr:FG-GAP-like repeat-containing protein [Hyalangium versicolor]